MKIVVFGASGMIGQGVLRECLLAPDVDAVSAVRRSPSGQRHEKLHEVVHQDLGDLSAIADELTDIDACFFCLGVSSAGMSEQDYRRVTYDLTMTAARTLLARNPDLTFVYVSGQGTGSGRAMWSRVKKETEDALLALPFQAYMFRPGFIRPLHGITSRTRLYRVLYRVIAPFGGLVERAFPRAVTTTEKLGRAMLRVARTGAPMRVLQPADINALA